MAVWTPGTQTGGPWALEQLVQCLVAEGVDARLINALDAQPDLPRAASAALAANTSLVGGAEVVISPEVWARPLLRITGVRRVLWWLSVDKAYPDTRSEAVFDLVGNAQRHERLVRMRRWSLDRLIKAPVNDDVVHVVQSEYARRHVQTRLRRAPLMLTDFLTDVEDDTGASAAVTRARPKIAYNATKGSVATQRVIREAPSDWDFAPVRGLTPRGVRELLRASDVYLDLGGHPGRDRLPREAALCGCVVVVGDRGAAQNAVDVPLPAFYKVPTPSRMQHPAPVVRVLSAVLKDLTRHQQAMIPYRETILGQRAVFEEEVRALIAHLTAGGDP